MAVKNAIQTAANAAKAPAQQAAHTSINTMMAGILDSEGMRKRFDELLGKRSPQFISSVVSMVNADNNLKQAFIESPMTVIQAALKCATFDLPVDQNLGYAYIVPFSNYKKDLGVKKMEATFILGWKGMHQLALRTGAYKTINVTDVRDGELKSYNRLTEEVVIDFIEDEDERESKDVVGYVGYYRLVNGAEKTIYMSKKAIENHEKKFRKGQYQGKGWRDSWDDMARKTVYRQLIGKWGVMSINYQTADEGKQLADVMSEDEKAESFIDAEIVNEEVVEEDVVDVETGEVINA